MTTPLVSTPAVETHSCIQHLAHKEHSWVETHGLDCGPYEHCRDEWEECTICGAVLTMEEVADLARISTCPACEGTQGAYVSLGHPFPEERWVDCSKCGGTGWKPGVQW